MMVHFVVHLVVHLVVLIIVLLLILVLTCWFDNFVYTIFFFFRQNIFNFILLN